MLTSAPYSPTAAAGGGVSGCRGDGPCCLSMLDGDDGTVAGGRAMASVLSPRPPSPSAAAAGGTPSRRGDGPSKLVLSSCRSSLADGTDDAAAAGSPGNLRGQSCGSSTPSAAADAMRLAPHQQPVVDQEMQEFLALVEKHVLNLRRGSAREAWGEAEAIVAQLRGENASLRAELARKPLSVGTLRNASDVRPEVVEAWAHQDECEKCGSDKAPGSVSVIRFASESTPSHRDNRVVKIAPQSAKVDVRPKASLRNFRHTVRQTLETGEKIKGKGLFADATVMKEEIRKAINRPTYNVHDLYWETGHCQKLAKNPWFETFTLIMILFNGIWLSIDADHNNAPTLQQADPIFQVADHLFCAFFLFEWVVRFGAFRKKLDGLRDKWFVFDSVMACFIVFDTWIMTIIFAVLQDQGGKSARSDTSFLMLFRLFRLTRLARVVKLLHAVPELMVLIKGLMVAGRSVLCTLILLVTIIYVFALAFKQLSNGTELGERRFDSVLKSMQTLLLDATLPDLADLVSEAGDENVGFSLLLMAFILLGTLTVMNMLIGVLVEVVKVVSVVEHEEILVEFVKTKLKTLVYDGDDEGDLFISRLEFEQLLVKPEAARVIQEIGVDVVGLADFCDMIFADTDRLSFGEFMSLVLKFRGTNTATVRDIVDLRKFIQQGLLKIDMLNSHLVSQQASLSLSSKFF